MLFHTPQKFIIDRVLQHCFCKYTGHCLFQKNENESSGTSESGMKNWILQYVDQSSSEESSDETGTNKEDTDPVSFTCSLTQEHAFMQN